MKTITKKTAGWLVMATARTRQVLTLAAAAAVMGMATASCSGGDSLAEEPKPTPAGDTDAGNTDAQKTYTMTVTATKGSDALTRALSYDSNTKELSATWTEGDKVEVYALNWETYNPEKRVIQFNIPVGTLTAQGNGASATLSGEINEPPAAPYQGIVTPLALVFPKYTIDYTGQKGTLEDIAENYDYAIGYVYSYTMTEEGTITTDDPVNFENQQAIVRFNLQDKDGNPIKAESLTIKDLKESLVQSVDGMNIVYGDIVITPEDPASEIWAALTITETKMNISLTATTASGDTYIYTKGNVAFSWGNFYSITVKMNRAVDLSKASGDITLKNGDIATGTMTDHQLLIEDGATVTLCGASVTAPEGWEHGAIRCLGDATIILADGTVNTAQSGSENRYAAVSVPAGKTLTISGGSAGTGKLVANAFVEDEDTGSYRAGIGGQAGEDQGGNLIIAGGDITAIGKTYGAGIGAAAYAPFGNITIKGGTVTATGGSNGAGIGSGLYESGPSECGNITIEGGTVTATGGEKGAGIGSGGHGGSCRNINISGGTVTAKGGKYAAGIGSGELGRCRGIYIKSTVTSVIATKGQDANNSIGAGNNGTCNMVSIADGANVTQN